MNTSSGVFTAPVPGTYHFAFSAVKESSSEAFLVISMQVNDKEIGRSFTELFIDGIRHYRSPVSLAASFHLKAGDRVNMRNEYGGSIKDEENYHHTHFTGWLVNEEMALVWTKNDFLLNDLLNNERRFKSIILYFFYVVGEWLIIYFIFHMGIGLKKLRFL